MLNSNSNSMRQSDVLKLVGKILINICLKSTAIGDLKLCGKHTLTTQNRYALKTMLHIITILFKYTKRINQPANKQMEHGDAGCDPLTA